MPRPAASIVTALRVVVRKVERRAVGYRRCGHAECHAWSVRLVEGVRGSANVCWRLERCRHHAEEIAERGW